MPTSSLARGTPSRRAEGSPAPGVHFTWPGNPAAVGFASTLDFGNHHSLPESITAFQLDSDPGRLEQLRTDRFTVLTRQGLEERGLAPFAAALVTDVALAVAADAVLRGEGIESLSVLDPSQWQARAEAVVDGVLLATTQRDRRDSAGETVLDALETGPWSRSCGGPFPC